MAEMNDTALTLALSALALAIGIRLPDIDLAPVLPLRHRSAWTHGPLLPAALYAALLRWPEWRWPVVALALGVALHLLADMWPRSWRGSARINAYPLAFVGGPVTSWCWLAAGVAGSLWIVAEALWPR